MFFGSLGDFWTLSIIRTFIIIDFAVARKSVITQVLNVALDRKIAAKLQNVQVVKHNTLTKETNNK